MRAVLLAVASLGLVGCVGELDGTSGSGWNGPSDDDTTNVARQMYDSNVYPIMKNHCSGCHLSSGPVGNVTGFVTPSLTDAHATIIGYTAVVGNFTTTTAPVLLKIQAGHNGVVYTSDEVQKITEWLNQELANQGAGGSGATETPSAATQRLMSQWSGCMTQDLFDAADMANQWGNMTANNNQRCASCHATGAEGYIATTDRTFFFDTISQNKYYMLQYFAVSGLDNPSTAMMVINTKSFLGVSQGQDPHREHPRFNATDNAGMAALKTFYDSVMLAVQNSGTTPCGPSKLIN